MTVSVEKPPKAIKVSGEGTFNVTFPGGVDVSAQGGVTTTSVRNSVDVSAHGVVSAAGHVLVSADGHALVSADGHVLVSADGTITVSANTGIFNVSAQGGSITVSAQGTFNVSAVGGVFNVSAQGGAISVSANTGVMTVSARAAVCSVQGNVAVSAAGRSSVYFAQPATYIADGAQAEIRTIVAVSGASAGNYALVSAPASGVTRVTRLMLTFTSATFVTFRGASAATSSVNYTGPLRILDGGSIVLDKSDSPWFVTTGTKNFSVNVSAGVGIAGAVWSY